MIQYQLKLRPTRRQERTLGEWLWILTGVWNWAVRKIELDARDAIFYSPKDFQNLLAGHGPKLEIPSHTVQGMLLLAHTSWRRCFKKTAKKPRLKGRRNTLNSIPFPDPMRRQEGHRIGIPGLGSVRFHKMGIPEGTIKCGRLVRRASGWYLCVFIDAAPTPISHVADGQVGIDPGFASLLTLSTGEKIEHPRELERAATRLAQAQRGRDKQLAARLQERITNQRKDRNHKLSRRLVAENHLIVFSADRHRAVAKTFGRSVASSGHAQLRTMLAYKSRTGGRIYREVEPRDSTKICSCCGAPSGPSGLAGLSVRQWRCGGCGALHDRDVNAARNALAAGAGAAHEGALCVA